MPNLLCPAVPLEGFVDRVCRAIGAPEDVAAEVAHHLVRANLSGHDSHGVLRLPWYVQQANDGQLLPDARPRILREGPATALFDAGRGFGHYSTIVALEWAMARAREGGLAAAAIRGSTHIGRLGEYPERAAAQGLIGIVTYGSAGAGTGLVVPFGGRERFLGTNPWAIGAPAGDRPPMIFDAATSTIAEGKVRVAQSRGVTLPQDSIVDRDGRPSTDPADLYDGGAMLPLGGRTAGHKGYGLAMASALIGGLAMIDESAADTPAERHDARGRMSGVFVLAIDPGAFGDGGRYADRVGETLAAAKEVPPAPGVEGVLVPGEPEQRSRAGRERDGIPIPEPIWAELTQISERFDVPLPEHRAG
ncbi:MAG: Ldh family oxidoreductase [Chloroflexota bacterium]|nr:Ldh family oxidoreductase [Chloroflexota bacterium]